MENRRGSGNGNPLTAERTALRRLGHPELDRLLQVIAPGQPARNWIMRSATPGSETLLDVLAEDRRFCRDTALGGVLHPGAVSFREIRGRPAVHIALGPQGRISAHVDHETPAVARRPDGSCLYARSRAARHIWRDVLPLLVRPLSGHTPADRQPVRQPARGWRPLSMLPVISVLYRMTSVFVCSGSRPPGAVLPSSHGRS